MSTPAASDARGAGRIGFAAGLLALCAVLAPAAADAAWTRGGTGSAAAKANSLGTVAQPTASVSNRSVTVNWSAPPTGAPPTAYIVRRYDNSNNLQTIGSACSGTIAVTTCTENAVPPGTWRYRVVPANANWRGAESAASTAVTLATPALSLSPAPVTTLPAALSGQITNYINGQTVTFRLDNPTTGAVLTGNITPSPVPANGTANVSITLPAGTAAGAHTVYAIGSLGDSASAPVTVLVPQTLVTSAWDLDDASAGGAEVNASDPVAFASDGRTVTTTAPAAAFAATRFLVFDQATALPSNATPSSATFDFRYAAAVLNTACFYFEVRRASTDALIATHGSTATPVGCVTGATQTSFSTPLPEVTSTAIANDLRVRVYMRSTLLAAPVVDLATVGVNTSQGAFTLYDDVFTDRLDTGTTDRSWPWVASSGLTYQSASTWTTAFAATRYLKLTAPTYVPSGATVSGASFVHRYRRVSSGIVCWYMEVLQGTTVIGTHGSATTPISCTNNNNNYVADTVSLPEINTPARANGAVLKLYLRSSTSQRSEHDQGELTINYGN
jgi:hypothetical protein